MTQIKQYLDDQTLDSTFALLHREEAVVEEKLHRLSEQKEILQKRIKDLELARRTPAGQFVRLTLPERRCVQLNEHITRDEEMDFLIKRLHQKYESQLRSFGTQTIGACFSMEDWIKGSSNVYRSVFFVMDDTRSQSPDHDFLLPAGEYISYFYRGSYEQNGERLHELFRYLSEKHLRPCGDPFELYKIDNRDTADPNEFLTEIQIGIVPVDSG